MNHLPLEKINEEIQSLTPEQIESVSDGYHTFAELYHFRLLYNACLFNEWARQGKNNWMILMGESYESVYDCEELEAKFQEITNEE